jgi:hypothetical protein
MSPPLSAQTKRLLFLESFLGNFLFTMCMIYGVSLTSAVSAGVIMAAIPAAVAVMSWAFLRERVPPRTWAAVACAVRALHCFRYQNQSIQRILRTSARAGETLKISPGWVNCC